MSLCSHNIIDNISFSWWGAYFNGNKDKIVCYPSVWFGPKLANKDTSDLCPDSWRLPEYEDYTLLADFVNNSSNSL